MSRKLVECVPNFSEGRNKETIEAIAEAFRNAGKGVRLLDVDPGESTNRTVYTLVGEPNAVIDAIISAAKVAKSRIDMRKHSGEHKRLGALDVCPFIPLQGTTMDDCVVYANECGRRLAEELQVPVYLYGFAAKPDAKRKSVPELREGEYESLAKRFEDSQFQKPDFGPATFVPSWGATMVGARKILLAYNVNLIATKEQANRIAIALRPVKPSGAPGRFKALQAMGWILKEHNIAQVTVNILDHKETSLHAVYEAVKEEAEKLKLPVTGSELVGLVPRDAMLDAAQFYIDKENLFVLEEDQKIHLAVQRLGLNSLSPFDPKKRVLEYMVEDGREGPLVSSTLSSFVRQVGDRTTAPGGGSVGAAVGALGAGLSSMVSKLSYGKKAFEATDPQMRKLIPIFHDTFNRLLLFVDRDTEAFEQYSKVCGEANALKNGTEEQKKRAEQMMNQALCEAARVPFEMAQLCSTLWAPLEELAQIFYPPTVSDFKVAIQCLRCAVYAAHYNVLANAKDAPEGARVQLQEMVQGSEQLCRTAEEKLAKLLSTLDRP